MVEGFQNLINVNPSYVDQIKYTKENTPIWHLLNRLSENIERRHPYKYCMGSSFFRDLAVVELGQFCQGIDCHLTIDFKMNVNSYLEGWIRDKAHSLSERNRERSSIDNWLAAEQEMVEMVIR